ncbi:ATP-dependent DNA helicase PIF1 [Octopus vulgaris]|uniref:ATP-dependent DNA helicase n=1 Tax=Octopus vulgaris TaxID=6645 RepID=A0AA36AKM7_OCTVU|nr:ATP-dependent DNA helicase PIF1 [Octopus vulgaris]
MPKIIAEKCNDDTECLRIVSIDVYNTDQKHNFDMVVNSVLQQENKVFALSTNGGTGKTYLINAIIDFIRSEKKIVLATSLRIAATLLPNDRTFHSRFIVPINITPESCCISECNCTTLQNDQSRRQAHLRILGSFSMRDQSQRISVWRSICSFCRREEADSTFC